MKNMLSNCPTEVRKSWGVYSDSFLLLLESCLAGNGFLGSYKLFGSQRRPLGQNSREIKARKHPSELQANSEVGHRVVGQNFSRNLQFNMPLWVSEEYTLRTFFLKKKKKLRVILGYFNVVAQALTTGFQMVRNWMIFPSSFPLQHPKLYPEKWAKSDQKFITIPR